MSDPISILVHLLIFVIILGLIWFLLDRLPVDRNIRLVIMVILIVIAVLYLLRLIGIWA